MQIRTLNKIDFAFNHEGIRAFLINFRYPISFAFLIIIIPHIKLDLLLPSFLISLFGELIQIWSFASLDKNKTLATKGPYCLIRNPIYIGRFFLLLGGMILIINVWIIPSFILFYYFYLINRVQREETNLNRLFGEEFRSYCSKVNRFFPSFKKVHLKPLLFFNWKFFLKNNAHWNLLIVTAIYLLFYLFDLLLIHGNIHAMGVFSKP